MKRFSRKWFSQIMIHKLLKHELDKLKKIVIIETDSEYEPSYGDVIRFLINQYYKTKEYPVEQKLRFSSPLRKSLSVGTKLDGKQRVSFSLEK